MINNLRVIYVTSDKIKWYQQNFWQLIGIIPKTMKHIILHHKKNKN
jgi:hypothetical protein